MTPVAGQPVKRLDRRFCLRLVSNRDGLQSVDQAAQVAAVLQVDGLTDRGAAQVPQYGALGAGQHAVHVQDVGNHLPRFGVVFLDDQSEQQRGISPDGRCQHTNLRQRDLVPASLEVRDHVCVDVAAVAGDVGLATPRDCDLLLKVRLDTDVVDAHVGSIVELTST